jgi:hypothetical protein
MVHPMDHLELDESPPGGRMNSMGGEIERRSIAAQLADRIGQEIRKGTWSGELPGKRTLAERFGVNVKTCAAALDLLEHRGWVGPAAAGSGREILAGGKEGPAERDGRGRRLLMIHPAAGLLSIADFQMLHRMGETWERDQGQAVWARVDYARFKEPGPVLDGLIARHSADAILLYVPELGWGRAAAARRPFYQVGGPYEADVPISLGAYALDREVQRVVAHLRGLGHRRILIPSESMSGRMHRSVVDGLREGGGALPDSGRWDDYCPVFPESVPAVWTSYWKRAFATLRPTAVVLFEDTHVLSLYGHCFIRGIRIPEDVSVVSIGYEARFEWCKPRPVMMRYPVKPAVAHFKRWLAGGLKPIGKKFFPLEMVAGESVARPPKERC